MIKIVPMALPFPDIDPVAISLGPIDIRWYALAYIAGFILGWKYAMHLAARIPNMRPNAQDIDDFLPWVVLGVILGGRLGYVLFYNLDYYLFHPNEILLIWSGGMSFHGGALGVFFAMLGYSVYKKFSFLRLADIIACAAPIGIFFGRLANFVNGELYGRATDVPWAFVFPRGGPEPRHPSQLYEAFLEGALLFAIMFLLTRREAIRNKPGFLGGVFLAGYGAGRWFVEFFREPDAHLGFVIWEVSMGQVLSAPMVAAGLCVMIWAWRRGNEISHPPNS